MRRLALLSLVLLPLTALAQHAEPPAAPPAPPPPATPESQPAAPAPPDSPPRITVLDRGIKPMVPLRVTPAVGSAQAYRLRMEMSSRMKSNGADLPNNVLPAMLIDIGLNVESIAPNGDITYSTRILATDAEPNRETDERLVDSIKGALAPLARLSGTCTMSASGVTKEARFDIPKDDSPLSGTLSNMRDQFKQFSVQFPDEGVGSGARWKVETFVQSQGMRILQVTTYTLKETRDDVAFLDVAIEQSADPQDIAIVNLPPDTKASLVSLKSTGSGAIELPLKQLIPRKSALKITSDLQMKIVSGDRVSTMDQSTSLATTITPLVPPGGTEPPAPAQK